jgi:hypothetical protein
MTLTKQERLLAEMQGVLNSISFYKRQILRLECEYKALSWEAVEDAEMPEK